MTTKQIPIKLAFAKFEKESATVIAFSSSGLEAIDLPNVLIVGNLRPELAMSLMDTVIGNWQVAIGNGEPLPIDEVNWFKGKDGNPLPGYLLRVNARAKEVPEEIKEMLTETGAINSPLVQLVWSDEAGAMPWDDNFDDRLKTVVLPKADQILN